jgi:hypothetical protein
LRLKVAEPDAEVELREADAAVGAVAAAQLLLQLHQSHRRWIHRLNK